MQKTSKCQKYITFILKTKDHTKDPSSFPKRRLQVRKKTMGILKKIKILKILPKLQVIQPYSTFKMWNWN